MGHSKNTVHFHIQWSGKPTDWERFDTRDEAETRAAEIVLPNERYTVEEYEHDCMRCRELLRHKLGTLSPRTRGKGR
jgi:hypothetical protein